MTLYEGSCSNQKDISMRLVQSMFVLTVVVYIGRTCIKRSTKTINGLDGCLLILMEEMYWNHIAPLPGVLIRDKDKSVIILFDIEEFYYDLSYRGIL